MISLQIHAKKGHSLSAQLAQQLRHGILAGRIASGERLPSVREISAQLGIHPLTIAKAYATLENEGLVQTRWGKGTFAVGGGEKKSKKSQNYVKELVSKFIEETLPLVNSQHELKVIFEEQLKTRAQKPVM